MLKLCENDTPEGVEMVSLTGEITSAGRTVRFVEALIYELAPMMISPVLSVPLPTVSTDRPEKVAPALSTVVAVLPLRFPGPE
jgi:hypothetical protein